MRSVRGWHPARLAAMLITYTGRRALAMEISKSLSMSLSRLLLRVRPTRLALEAACRPKPSLRGGGPPGLRPVPHRAGALGRQAGDRVLGLSARALRP